MSDRGSEALLSHVFPVAAFMAAVAMATSGAILLAGHFPAQRLPDSHRLPSWRLLVWLNVVLLAGLLAVAVGMVAAGLRWPVAVIAGGLALLFGPLLYQMVPRKLVDQRATLVGQAIVVTAMLVLLWWMMAPTNL